MSVDLAMCQDSEFLLFLPQKTHSSLLSTYLHASISHLWSNGFILASLRSIISWSEIVELLVAFALHWYTTVESFASFDL